VSLPGLRALDASVFGALFFLASVVYVPSFPQGSIPKWEIIYLLALYGAVRGFRLDGRVAAFVGLACVSLLWSDDPGAGALQLQKLVACAIVCLWIAKSGIEERHVSYAIAASFPVVAWLVLTGEYWGSFGNENFLTEWIILACPWLLAPIFRMAHRPVTGQSNCPGGMERRDRIRTGLVVFGWSALALAGVAYLVCRLAPGIEFFVAFVGCVTLLWLCKQRAWAVALFCVGCGGVIGGDIALDSLTARLEFWTNSSFVWLSSPLWGHGFGSFNFQYPRFDSVHLLLFPSMGHTMGATNFAGAAHN